MDAVQKDDLQYLHQFNGSFGCGACYHPGKHVKIRRGFTNVHPFTKDHHPLRSTAETMKISNHVDSILSLPDRRNVFSASLFIMLIRKNETTVFIYHRIDKTYKCNV